ncbi:cytochrome P450 [Streptomyces sp. SID12501]|uniref:Cytochrome P450 n=1 Tax=Streptomyces sp. SID12501 TaxID=2706042 RepID=A0A6B3BQ00_9ACTN|nr:cytochrome P450 [Streptomyces sp. SID12501]NEC86410.1 cytochrome P450 [Streptomyces sp. SID12501]
MSTHPLPAPAAAPVPPEHERQAYVEQVRADGTDYDLLNIGGLDMWSATGYQQAKQLLTDPRVVNSPSPVTGRENDVDLFALGPTLTGRHVLRADGTAHARLRATIAPAFSRAAVLRRRAFITRTVERLLDGLPGTDETDLVESFARPLVNHVLGHAMGLTEDQTRRHAVLQRRNSDATDATTQRRTAFALSILLQRVLSGSEGAIPQDSLMASMLRPPRAITPLSYAEAVENLIAVYRAGLIPTISALAFGAARLAQEQSPQAMTALQDPGRTEILIEELLRLQPPHAVTTPRVTAEPIETDNGIIPRGSTVTACLVTANRDRVQYTAPDEMRLDRTRPPKHLAFGWGPHSCVGAVLARQILHLALPALFGRYPRLRLTLPLEEIRFHGSYSDRIPIALPVVLDTPAQPSPALAAASSGLVTIATLGPAVGHTPSAAERDLGAVRSVQTRTSQVAQS